MEMDVFSSIWLGVTRSTIKIHFSPPYLLVTST